MNTAPVTLLLTLRHIHRNYVPRTVNGTGHTLTVRGIWSLTLLFRPRPTNSGGCIVCPFALARKFLFLRDEHLVSIDGVLGVLKRARDDASLFASLVCTDADRIRTTGGSPLLETVEPERYVMA